MYFCVSGMIASENIFGLESVSGELAGILDAPDAVAVRFEASTEIEISLEFSRARTELDLDSTPSAAQLARHTRNERLKMRVGTIMMLSFGEFKMRAI